MLGWSSFRLTDFIAKRKVRYRRKARIGELAMAFVSWLILWIIFASVGLILVYRMGLYIERQWPTLGLFYFVLSGPGILVASWMVADQITGREQAGCEEMAPVPIA
jgi:hypothetical protein